MKSFLEQTTILSNPEFDQVDGSVERTLDDCIEFFHRFKQKCVLIVKFLHETHSSTSLFTLSNKYIKQCEQKKNQMNLTTN